MSYRKLFIIIFITMLGLVSLPSNLQMGVAQDESSRRIVFTSNRTGNYEIYTMNPDGTGITQLTLTPENEGNPIWSPDYGQIFFVRDVRTAEDGTVEQGAFIMNADGSEQRMISEQPVTGGPPVWSPDGTKIMVGIGLPEDNDLFVINVATDELTQLTRDGGIKAAIGRAWSPDSTRFTYSSDGSGSFEIYVVNVETGDITTIADSDLGNPISPDWSPVDDTIIFDIAGDVWSVNADGSNLTQLSSGSALARTPTFSPDGSLIAFRFNATPQQAGEGIDGIGIMNADGSNVRIVLQPVARIRVFAWSPDGTRIVFSLGEPGAPLPGNTTILDIATGELTSLQGEGDVYHDGNPDW